MENAKCDRDITFKSMVRPNLKTQSIFKKLRLARRQKTDTCESRFACEWIIIYDSIFFE